MLTVFLAVENSKLPFATEIPIRTALVTAITTTTTTTTKKELVKYCPYKQ